MTERHALTRKQRRHTCHYPGCEKLVDPALWGCRPHWMSLPRDLRARLREAYRPGQEIRPGIVTPEYIAAARAIQGWIYASKAAQRGQDKARAK